jgi:lipopolysaccharide export system protein LptA
MQRTVRILRYTLPVAFAAFLLLIVVSWNQTRGGKERQPLGEITSTIRPRGEVAQAEAIAFEDTQTIGGRVVSRIRANRVVAFKSGWNTLESVQLTIYRENGLTYELLCPQAQYNSETKEADAKGGVKLTSTDGVEIATAEIHYDGSRLTNRIPVQFRVDQWRGKAGALDLDVPGETLRLFQTVAATMTPSTPAESPMTLEATDGVFRRRENDVTFTEKVLMTRAADRLIADRMVGRFTQDRTRIIGMEGFGHVEIIMSSAAMPGENLGGRKQISCERFFTEVGPDGQITAFNALSDAGLARAVVDGPPKRDLVAKAFRIALQNRAVSEMKAESQVVMNEFGETEREIRTDKLTVSFDPVQHRATTAFMDGNFKYRDPKNTASAIRANYDIANDRVLLTAMPGFDPTIVTDGQTLKAKQIEFSPRAGTAKATGEVIAHLVSKGGGPAADSTNLFPASSAVFVNSDLLIMRQATKVAVFSGNVKAWQDTNTVFAQELQVQGGGQTISARGNVRTMLYNAGTEQRKTPVSSRSEQLLMKRADQRVDLIGGVRIEDEARTLTGEHATLFFDAKRKIERIEAENKVTLTEKSTARKVTGDKATYHVNKRMAYLNGKPATATDPAGTLTGEQIVFDLARNRFSVISPTDKTQGTYKQQ